MGCAQSRVDNEEAVSRCKERRQLMKAAVIARNAFAAAHSAYAVALKNTGASLSEFAQGEAHDHRSASDPSSSSSAAAPSSSGPAAGAHPGPSVQPPIDTLLPPPPPLPEFSPSPLQRSISMPDLPKKKLSKLKTTPDSSFREEDEENVEEDEEDHEDGAETAADDEEEVDLHRLDRLRPRHYGRGESPASISPVPTPPPPPRPQPSPPPPPMQDATWDYFFAMDENMAGHSLSHAEEIQPEREVIREERLDRSQVQPPPPPPAVDHDVVGDDIEPVTPKKVVSEAPLPPRPPRKQKQGNDVHHQHTVSAPPIDSRRGKMVAAAPQSVNLLQVLKEIDDHFLKAYESAHEVSKMLEATRMHYHSNFADTRGHIDHSSRVMRVITWNRSFKGIPNGDDAHNDLDDDEGETHATVLDKMLAWEKKLYDEVKAGELMKIEYQRKVALLNRQKKRGATTETLERTKAAVSHLHTRYIVDMQSMDSTVLEIQRLRDKQLYPRLVDLVDGMAKMWKTMYDQHEGQLKIVFHFKSLDILNANIETSDDHYKRTKELCDIVKIWYSQLQEIVNHQKEYIRALNSWLKLNLIPIESSLKEKVSSPPRPSHAPIQTLLQAWHEHLDKLPDELAKSAILSFSAVINTIVSLQQEEMKQKEKCEDTHRDYIRKSRAFEDWHHKYTQRRAASEEAEHEGVEGAAEQKDPIAEKRFIVDSLKSRLDDELENHKKLCKQVREKSLNSLKTHLPELFRAILDFARASCEMYYRLKLITAESTGQH